MAETEASLRPSPLAMVVLLLLDVEPLHPYGLRQRIKEWDKDRVVNVSQRNAIYQTIARLERAGLIEVQETAKGENRPERTVYRVTKDGVRIAKSWLRDMLANPVPEYPQFPAALAFFSSLPAKTALRALESRATVLEDNITRLDKEVAAQVAEVPGGVDRIYLIEIDYQRTMWQSELTWVCDLVAHIKSS